MYHEVNNKFRYFKEAMRIEAMYVEKDYVLPLIHEIIRMLLIMISGNDFEEEDLHLGSYFMNILMRKQIFFGGS